MPDIGVIFERFFQKLPEMSYLMLLFFMLGVGLIILALITWGIK